MALNPLRIQVPHGEHLGSFPLQLPGPGEFARLQEMLSQALKREAEAHRKMKHMYEQIQDTRARSLSEGSQSGTPDIIWDSELSQTSEGSPHSLPPAVIVIGSSPALQRKVFSPVPQLQKQWDYPSSPTSSSLNGERFTRSPDQEALAPSPQDYRGVKQERERPPPSLSPVLSPALPFIEKTAPQSPPLPSSSSPLLSSPPAQPAATTHHTESRYLESADGNGVLHGVGDKMVAQSFTTSLPSALVGRSSSFVEKRKGKVGHRSRSNTAHILPNWIRRKVGIDQDSSPSGSAARTPQKSPLESIEVMFERYMDSAKISLHQDSLALFIDHHWSEVCVESATPPDVRKYRDAVWDLFQTEAKFLIRFLQPLEQVYKGFLEELHFHGILKVADVDKIFANLSELCELSSSVANDLFKLFEERSGNGIAPNKELILAFSMFGHKFNPVYQRFCVNFEKQRGFVRALEQLPDFVEYMRVCRNHEAVGKNDLAALLIAPMKHQCHYQLLLEKVLKYTKNKSEKDLLSSAIKAFAVSLKELEANIDENRRSAEMLELQETLCWPTLSQLDPTAYIPEVLSSQLSSQPCSCLLASKDRQLVHHGHLKLMEGKHPRDIVAFLFTDSLLLTQHTSSQSEKKSLKKEQSLTRYSVVGHPLLLDMLDIHAIPLHHHHGHLITLIERNQFQQQVGIYSLQLQTKYDKAKWISQLTQTKNIISYRTSSSFMESDV